MPINPFRRVLSPTSGSKNGKRKPSIDSNAIASSSKLPEVTISASGSQAGHGDLSTMQGADSDNDAWREPRLPDNSFRQSLIMPHLTKRFTLLRAPDGSMVTPEAMRAHLRAQRARARATGAPGTQCFLTEEEEDEIISQLQLQTQGDESEAWDESVESQHVYENEKSGLGGTDGFGSWGSQHARADIAGKDRRDSQGNARFQSLAESLGDLPAQSSHDGSPSGGGFFTSRSSARDLAYIRDVKRSRVKNEGPQPAALDTSDEGHHIGDIAEEDAEATPEEEIDGSGMPGDLFTAEKHASMLDPNPDASRDDVQRRLAPSPSLGDDTRAESRLSERRTAPRQSQLLTSLTPEAFNRVSTALAEVYGLVHGRVDDGDSDADEDVDETFESSAQDDQRTDQLHEPLGEEGAPTSQDRDMTTSLSYLERELVRDGVINERVMDEDEEEEEELVDLSGSEDGRNRGRRSVDSDEHSFTSAHSEMLHGGQLDPFRAGPPVIHMPNTVSQATVPFDLHHGSKDSDPARRSTDADLPGADRAIAPAALNGWTSSSLASPAPVSVDHDGPDSQQDEDARSQVVTADEEQPLASTSLDQDLPLLAADQTIPGGPTLAWSSSSDEDAKPSERASPEVGAAHLGTSGDMAAPNDARQAPTPLLAPLHSRDNAGSGSARGNNSLLAPDAAAAASPSPLFAGLHFAGIGDRKSAIAAATAAGVAAASYVAQAQANTRAQKLSMDEQRNQVRSIVNQDTSAATAAAEAANGVDSQDQPSEIGNEVMSAGPSRIAAFSPDTATTPTSEVTAGMYDPTSPGAETIRPWGQMPTSTPPQLQQQQQPQSQQASAHSAAASEVLSADAIAARSQRYFPSSSARISQYADGFKPTSSPVLSQRTSGADDVVAPMSLHGQKPSLSGSSDVASISPSSTSRSNPSIASQQIPSSAAALHTATLRESTPRHSPTKGSATNRNDRQVENGKALSPVEEPPSMINSVVGGTDGQKRSARVGDETEDTFFDDEDDEDVWDRVARNTSSPQQQLKQHGSPHVASPLSTGRDAAAADTSVSIDHLREIQENLVRSASAKQQTIPSAAFADGTAVATALSPSHGNEVPPIPSRPNQPLPRGLKEAFSDEPALAQDHVAQALEPALPITTEEAIVASPQQQRESSASSVPPLERDTSTRSFRSQVMYDVTKSHRPTSPMRRSQKQAQSSLPALQQEQQQPRTSAETERNASLAAMIEQTNKAHDAIPYGNDTTEDISGAVDPIPEEQDEDYEEVSREDGFGGLIVETRSIPRSKSNDGTSVSSTKSPRTINVDGAMQSPRFIAPEHKDINEEINEPTWGTMPQEEGGDVSPKRNIEDDVATQARTATEALKGTNPQKPTLRSSSLGKKGRKKLAKHISQPELLRTSQRLDHAEPIQQPDKTLRKKEGYESSYVPPSDAQARAIPVHPLSQKKPSLAGLGQEPQRRPMTATTRTNSNTSNPANASDMPPQMQRAPSSGTRTPIMDMYRPMTPRDGATSPRLPSSSPGRDVSGEKTGSTRGLARFMSRIRSRDKLDTVPSMAQANERDRDITPTQMNMTRGEPLPSPSISEGAAAQRRQAQAERKARRIENKRSAPSLTNIGRANIIDSAAGALSNDTQASSPPPRSSSQRQRPRAAHRVASPTLEPDLEEVSQEKESSFVDPLIATPPPPPPHARIKSPASKSPQPLPAKDKPLPAKDITAKDANGNSSPTEVLASPRPKSVNKSARDTIVRRTIIVSTYDPHVDDRRKSGAASTTAQRKAEGSANGSGAQRKSPESPTKRTKMPENTSPTSPIFSDSTGHSRKKVPSPQSASDMQSLLTHARPIDASANTTLAVPETDASMRTSNISGYGGSIYDLYADRDNSSFEGSYSQSQHHGAHTPPLPIEKTGGLDPSSAMGTRRIEVTERADGSVVWQVIAGLADRNSTYSTSFAFDDRLSHRASGASQGSGVQDRNSRVSGTDANTDRMEMRPTDLTTNEDGRSLFTRSRGGKHRKSFSFDNSTVPPLPGASADHSAADATIASGIIGNDTAEAMPRQSSTGKGKNGARTSAMDQDSGETGATRIVYTSDAELAAMLEQLAGPDKASAKFAFQRVGEDEPVSANGINGNVIYAGNGARGKGAFDGLVVPQEETLTQSHESIGVDVRRGAGGGGGWKASDRPDSEYDLPAVRRSRTFDGPGRPVSIVTDADITSDPSGALRQQRFKIEAEIYSLLQRGTMAHTGDKSTAEKRTSGV